MSAAWGGGVHPAQENTHPLRPGKPWVAWLFEQFTAADRRIPASWSDAKRVVDKAVATKRDFYGWKSA